MEGEIIVRSMRVAPNRQPIQLECERQLRAEGFRPELRIEPLGWRWPGFCYEVDQYMWILSGQARLVVNGEPVDLANGDRVLIPARSIHSLENTGSTSLVWLAAFRDETSLPAKPDSAGEAEAGMTFSRYAQQYLERWHRTQPIVEADRYRLAVLMAHFGAKRLGDISPIDIERFKLERRKSPTRTGQLRSLSSINRELRLLRRVLSSALREGLIPMDPMKGKVELYREGHRGERLLTREEEARLLAACTGRHEYLRPILVCALYTGLHRDELFNLKWSDINFRENLIYIRQSKVGKPRAIHMNGNVRAEIESLGSLAAEHEFVFAGLHAEPAPTSFRRDFQAACRVAGVEGLRFQDLRHTFAVRLARSSGNILDVARVLGLTRISAAMRYAHALPDRLAEAMDRLSRPTAEIVLMPTKTRVAV